MPPSLAVDDVAELLGLHPRTVRRRAADGRLPATRDALGCWWFDPEVIHAHREQQEADKTAREQAVRTAAAHAKRLEDATAVPEWLTTSEAARILRVGVRTVRKHLAAGTLPGRDFGGVWRVHRSGVEPPAPPTS
ncbi:helix-turn-helix domain-containing protein [Streptomyces sp. DSM 41013]